MILDIFIFPFNFGVEIKFYEYSLFKDKIHQKLRADNYYMAEIIWIFMSIFLTLLGNGKLVNLVIWSTYYWKNIRIFRHKGTYYYFSTYQAIKTEASITK